LIWTSYDIGYLVACIPLQFLPKNTSFGRTIGIAGFLVSTGIMMFAIPHFATDPVNIDASGENATICTKSARISNYLDTNQSQILK